MAYAVSINYGGGAVDLTNYTGVNLVRQDSFSRTETLYNQDRKAVVNTARFSIDMNTTLANALLTLDSDQEITCTITKDAAAWFTGYIRPVTDFTVSTGAEQIDFEAVDRLYFLQRQLGSTLAKVSTDSMVVSASGGGATSLVHALTSAISFPGTVYAADIDDEIVYFREEAGENGRTVFDILNDLLFSYHHVFYADAAGDLRMHDWSPASISPAGTFNGANIIESLTVSRDDKDETGVAVTYYTTTTVEDKRVVNGQEYGVVFLESSDKYPPEYTDDYSEKYWHWGFDETEDLKCIGAVYASSRYFVDNVIYIIKKRLWVGADSNYSDGNGHTFTVTANTHSSATATSTFYGVGTGVGIGAYEVYADVTYKKRVGAVYYPATTTTKIKKFDAPLVYTKTAADELASALYDMLTLGCFKYRFRSAVAAGIGTYYTVADTTLNISTTTRITKRTTTQILGTEYYEYEAEGAGEISTLTTETQIATVPAPVNDIRVDVPIDGGVVTEKVSVDSTEVTIAGDTSEGNQRLLLAEDGARLQTYETDTWETKASLLQVPATKATSEIYYAFEDDVTDSGTAAEDGTAYGTPTYVTGQVGKAISLNGTDQYVTMPNVADRLFCDSGTEFTVGMWVYPVVLENSKYILSKHKGDGSGAVFALQTTAIAIYATIRGTTSGEIFLSSGAWTHVAVTWDGTTAKIYKNGTYTATLTAGAGVDDTGQSVFIGARMFSGSTVDAHFNGYIDELRIVPTSTVAGVLDLYQNGAPGSTVLSVNEVETAAISSPSGDLYACRAWVNFDGTTDANQAATYSRTGTTVTVTLAGHGYLAGHVVYCNFTSGGALDGIYSITGVPTADTFTLTTAASGTIAAGSTLELNRRLIRASGNVHSVSYLGTGRFAINFITAMPDANYAAFIQGVPDGSSAAGLWRTQDVKTAVCIQFYTSSTSSAVDYPLTSAMFIR